MSVVIPDEILHAAQMTADEFKQEIAMFLFEKQTDPGSGKPSCRYEPSPIPTFARE